MSRKKAGKKKTRCWKGYKPTPGKVPYSSGSCMKEDVYQRIGRIIAEKKPPAWQRSAGKNPEGGLTEKGRKSYEAANPGSDLKAPQPEGGARKRSFCARMSGMRKRQNPSNNTGKDRLSLSLKKWNC